MNSCEMDFMINVISCKVVVVRTQMTNHIALRLILSNCESRSESLELIRITFDHLLLGWSQHGVCHFSCRLLDKILVKVCQLSFSLWNIGRRQLLGEEFVFIDVCKPRMGKNFINAV